MSLPKIYGFNKMSEAGVDVFAPSIFLGGCNLRCPYCMNARLSRGDALPEIDIQVVKDYVKEDGSAWIMIGGGEPTLTPQDSFRELLEEIRSWGCKIGLSTNGSQYHVLYNHIKYFDYVALDIKSGLREHYESMTDQKDIFENVICSRFFLSSTKRNRQDFNYELRTTLYPPLVNIDSLKKIGEIMGRDDTWILQQFRHNKNMLSEDAKKIQPYTDDEIKALMKVAKEYCDNVSLRYV